MDMSGFMYRFLSILGLPGWFLSECQHVYFIEVTNVNPAAH